MMQLDRKLQTRPEDARNQISSLADAENARHEIAEHEKAAPNYRDGKCKTGKCGKRCSEQLSITGAPRGTVVCGEFQAVIVDNSC